MHLANPLRRFVLFQKNLVTMSPAGLANVLWDVTPTPHDALFRSTFGQPRHAAAELRAVLPAPVLAELALDTLAPLDGAFVDGELRSSCVDLLFDVKLRTGGSGLVYFFVIEHQSKPDRQMPLRLLQYMTQVWTRHAARHRAGKRLPPIVPVLIHHGAKPWPWPRDFRSMLTLPKPLGTALGPRLLDFEFVIDDLARLTDAELLARTMDGIARLVLVALHDANVKPHLFVHVAAAMKALHRDLRGPGVVRALAQLVRYVLDVGKDPPDEVRAALAAALPSTYRSSVMTTADQLRAQGRTEGKTEGRLEARREDLLELLSIRFGPLGATARRRIEKANLGQLIAWLRRFVIAKSVTDVFVTG